MRDIKLMNDLKMPMIGLGVWQAPKGDMTYNAVRWALENGYCHIDAAMIYGNEVDVGNAILDSGVPREEIFVTTKCWNEDIRQKRVLEAFEESLTRLNLDYVDLYLIHWPATGFEDAWLELEKLYNDKRVKAIGVCNFNVHHYESLMKKATIKPMVNQIEIHPYFNNQALVDFYQKENIVVQAYSPLGSTGAKIINDPVILKLAEKYNKTGAQIVLRWNLERNVVVLPKSVNENRIIENFDIFDFSLTKEDMTLINDLNTNVKVGADPDNFSF